MTERATAGVTFAVPDLHGRRDLLDEALFALDAYRIDDRSRLAVFLGDYVDRGPNGADVLERLTEGAPVGWRWICLKGNHEAMMSVALHDPDQLDWWIGNGGDKTIESYRGRRDLVAAHLAWIDALPYWHEDAHRVFVHGGVDNGVPLDAQDEDVLLWKRYPPGDPSGYGDRHVVHGHDRDDNGPLLGAMRSNLDTAAWMTGRLVIGVFDDDRPGGPIDLIEVRRRAEP